MIIKKNYSTVGKYTVIINLQIDNTQFNYPSILKQLQYTKFSSKGRPLPSVLPNDVFVMSDIWGNRDTTSRFITLHLPSQGKWDKGSARYTVKDKIQNKLQDIYFICKFTSFSVKYVEMFFIFCGINTTTAHKFCTCVIGRSGPSYSMFESKNLN